MKKTGTSKTDLRLQAEEKLAAQKKKAAGMRGEQFDTLRLIHELEVHQIELEMQNEQLMQAQAGAEAARHQYADLYDFAPVGYFTLTRNGTIRRVNLAGASLLGAESDRLIKRRLGIFVSTQSRAIFNVFLEKIFECRQRETCEVELRNEGDDSLWVRIEANCSGDLGEVCHAIVSDITEHKRMEEANEVYSRENTLLEERQRIAAELHDAVSQTLFSARLTAETLLRQPDRESDSFTHLLMDLNRLVRSASGEIRLALVELRNNALLNADLKTLIGNLIDSGMARTNAKFIFQYDIDDVTLPTQVKLAFYRIAQEALSNAIKHSKSANINCIVRENGQTLEMIVQDDGKGFCVDQAPDDCFGMQIMRERADQAGAKLIIASEPGKGTSVTVCWAKEQS